MKIAVITGASSGMGREFARKIVRLYKNLDEIWLVARRTDRLKELEKELSVPVRIFDGDLGRDYIYERIGKDLDRTQADIRMLVNAAGYGKVGAFSSVDEKEQLGMIDINCRALTRMTALCLPYLSCKSRIINVASAAAFAPQPGFGVYAASKSYVYSLSMSLGRELKEKGIYVTAVCPGPVDTEFFQRSGELPGGVRKAVKADAGKVVHQALVDAVRGKSVSVYGLAMKSSKIAAKLLPDGLVVSVMKKINDMGSTK